MPSPVVILGSTRFGDISPHGLAIIQCVSRLGAHRQLEYIKQHVCERFKHREKNSGPESWMLVDWMLTSQTTSAWLGGALGGKMDAKELPDQALQHGYHQHRKGSPLRVDGTTDG